MDWDIYKIKAYSLVLEHAHRRGASSLQVKRFQNNQANQREPETQVDLQLLACPSVAK